MIGKPERGQTWLNRSLDRLWRSRWTLGAASLALLAVGGMASGGLGTTTVYDYDIAADTWTARAPLLSAVFSPGSGVLYDKIWVFGGGSSSQAERGPGSADRTISTGTQIYDPATDNWTSGPSLNQERRGLSGTVVGPWVIAVAVAATALGTYLATKTTETCELCSIFVTRRETTCRKCGATLGERRPKSWEPPETEEDEDLTRQALAAGDEDRAE